MDILAKALLQCNDTTKKNPITFCAILKTFCSVNSKVSNEDRRLAKGIVTFTALLKALLQYEFSDLYETVSLVKGLPIFYTFVLAWAAIK